jgi:hypothetical protein
MVHAQRRLPQRPSPMAWAPGPIAVLMLFALWAPAGCGVGAPPSAVPEAPPPPSGPPLSFAYDTLDGKALSSETTTGRFTVIGFITTYDLASQAEVRFLAGLGRAHAPRVNVAALVLEPRDNRPLVEAFVTSLGIWFPVALADAETIAGRGPFADLHHVPSVIILDKQGREAFRHVGLIEQNELDGALRALERAAAGSSALP